MRRFDYNEDDFGEDLENFDDMGFDGPNTPDDYDNLMQQQFVIQQAQIDMVGREQDQRLLYRAIKMAERSFFWRFRTISNQNKIINKIYSSLYNTMNVK